MFAETFVAMGKAIPEVLVETEAFGNWPGGVARVVKHEHDPMAPEIVMTVEHLTAKNPEDPSIPWRIGVFDHEYIYLFRPD